MEKHHVLILAAGQGKRMHSKLPKVLHPVLYKPMVHHVLDLAYAMPHASISLVVGNGEKLVIDSCASYTGLNFVVQAERKGTGHAVMMAEPFLRERKGNVLILSGDVILLRPETLQKMMAMHDESRASCTLLSAVPASPTGYGRVIKNGSGAVIAIREELDCSEKERGICEVNAGAYLFRVEDLLMSLSKLTDNNRQKEYYLTDTLEVLSREGRKVTSFALSDPREMEGINDRVALNKVERILQERINREWMAKGVSIHCPETVFIDPMSRLARDVVIESNCRIVGSEIGEDVVIEAESRILHSRIGPGTRILQGSYIEKSLVGEHCSIGPYAHLRPGSSLENEVKIGNYVEVKKSRFGKGSKASHLSYIGDAEIGQGVNLGCGFITCNYDGKNKHVTVIEDEVFVGSDSQTVAPVTIGRGSYIASGSTVTDNVPPDSLVISRGRQTTRPGYAKKYDR